MPLLLINITKEDNILLQYKHGNIATEVFTTDDIDILFHQCNCFNTMGKGVAKDLSSLFPSVREVDNATKYGDKKKLGNFTVTKVYNINKKPIYIFNLYGQYGYRYGVLFKDKEKFTVSREYDRKTNKLLPLTNKEALSKAIDKMLSHEYCNNKDLKYATVKIGCGLGRANWYDDICPMIEDKFQDKHLTVYRF